jgi:flagellar hook-associated protein 1 FlgK
MSQGGLFGIGTSALQSYQRALQVTGNNIANAGTEGYSRQRLEFTARQPEYLGFGALGTGVQASGVTRVAEDYVQLRIGMAASSESYQRTMLEFSRQLDNLLADPETGAGPAMQQFFAAVQDVASDPTSAAARQQLLARAEVLSSRFAGLEGEIEQQRGLVDQQLRITVEEINQLSTSIADLNRQIVEARGRSGGRTPNDLLDRRDVLLQQLAERVGINTVTQDDGSVNVFMGRGQSLVLGTAANRLQVQPMAADPTRLDVAFDNGSATVVVTDYLSGGRIGALLDLRDEVLDPASLSLGRTALTLAETFNATHQTNLDLNGDLGGAFFSVAPPRVQAASGNAGSGLPTLAIVDAGALALSDYDLRFDGSEWSLRRLADGQTVGTIPAGGSLEVDGLALDLSSVTGAGAGDRFLLQPLRAADGLGVAITDPRAVAAALPVTAEPAAANTGSLSVYSLTVTDAGNAALRAPLQVRFSGGAYDVGGTTVTPDASGETVIEANGWRLVLRGTPAEGDVIDVRDNAGAVGDNRGALALAGIAETPTVAGGTATLADSYAQLVSDVGVRTQRAQANADTQGRILADARAQRESVSGVNLDEEAANLLRYQQAYAAAAQVIATANTMFDTLLNAMRR